MATKIAITPRLNSKASKVFTKKVSEELQQTVGPKPTPKIDAVIDKFTANANRRSK